MGRKTKKQLRGWPGGPKKPKVAQKGGVQQQPGQSASSRKLEGSALPEPTQPADGSATGYRIIDLVCLQAAFVSILHVTCRRCHSNNVVIAENEDKRKGLMSVLRLKCLDCTRHGQEFETSRLRPIPGGGKSYDVNRRAAFASVMMGDSRSGMEQFCAAMGMPPPPNERPWRYHLKNIGQVLQQTAENSSQRAVDAIRTIRGQGGQLAEDQLLDEIVSFDGTWAKRGHSSLFGVQAAIHMETGKILDTQVHSKICNVCRAAEKKYPDKNKDEYLNWARDHRAVCDKNTDKSSNAMEAQGAKEIWGRSIKKNRMRYTTFVGDGDSKAYKTVCDDKPYGDIDIKKADCIGHVQKRMGSRLREWKKKAKGLEDGKSAGGKGRLTDDVIDKMQTYYGMAIRSNLPNVQAMSTATRTILQHSVRPFTPSQRRPWPGDLKGKKAKKVKEGEKQLTKEE